MFVFVFCMFFYWGVLFRKSISVLVELIATGVFLIPGVLRGQREEIHVYILIHANTHI